MKNDIYPSTIGKNKMKRLSKLSLAVFLFFCGTTQSFAHEFDCGVKGQLADLPALVLTTRKDIMETAAFGNMNPMLEIAERNEIWPVPSFDPNGSYDEPPIHSWVEQSHNTSGRYVLAQMFEILSLPYIKKPLNGGVDMYVWPYFADLDLTYPCTEDMIDMLKIVSPEDYNAMRQTGRYTGFQFGITTDGTWQYFARKNLIHSKSETITK